MFLDEIGELSPALQVKLLRVLQEREFERVGGTRTIKVDIRLITATNRNLEEAVAAAEFRQDLYYRLNVVSLEMPPLRDRPEDIPLLANYFAAKYGEKCNRRITGIAAAARTRLLSYDWPGNVRELENAIERAIVLGTTEQILLEDLPESILESEPPATAPGTKYHESGGPNQEADHSKRDAAGERELHRSRKTSRRASKLFAPLDSQSESERAIAEVS